MCTCTGLGFGVRRVCRVCFAVGVGSGAVGSAVASSRAWRLCWGRGPQLYETAGQLLGYVGQPEVLQQWEDQAVGLY